MKIVLIVIIALMCFSGCSQSDLLYIREHNQHSTNPDSTLYTLRATKTLVAEHQVNIVVIPTTIENNTRGWVNNFSWQRSVREELVARYESMWLKCLGSQVGFSLVDRSSLQTILNEQTLSVSGLISDKDRIDIGNMTGATHLLIVSFARFPYGSGEGYNDVVILRLIAVETGRVLAVDQRQTNHNQ